MCACFGWALTPATTTTTGAAGRLRRLGCCPRLCRPPPAPAAPAAAQRLAGCPRRREAAVRRRACTPGTQSGCPAMHQCTACGTCVRAHAWTRTQGGRTRENAGLSWSGGAAELLAFMRLLALGQRHASGHVHVHIPACGCACMRAEERTSKGGSNRGAFSHFTPNGGAVTIYDVSGLALSGDWSAHTQASCPHWATLEGGHKAGSLVHARHMQAHSTHTQTRNINAHANPSNPHNPHTQAHIDANPRAPLTYGNTHLW